MMLFRPWDKFYHNVKQSFIGYSWHSDKVLVVCEKELSDFEAYGFVHCLRDAFYKHNHLDVNILFRYIGYNAGAELVYGDIEIDDFFRYYGAEYLESHKYMYLVHMDVVNRDEKSLWWRLTHKRYCRVISTVARDYYEDRYVI